MNGTEDPPGKVQHKHYKHHDRGNAVYVQPRRKEYRPHLVVTGRHAGRSNLKYLGSHDPRWKFHLWSQDFLTSIAIKPFLFIIGWMFFAYVTSYLLWALVWFIVLRTSEACVVFAEENESFLSAFLFSVELQATIGFGTRATGICWSSAIVMTLQNVYGMILDGIWVGIVFAKISLPKHRGRSIFFSECATIARRDGQLKFMFRIVDIRSNTAVDAKVRALLYTWGGGRTTAEGEYLPVRVEALELPAIETLLLLPTVLEHPIDERSPLHGVTHDQLVARGAEIVVTFEGTSDFGDSFMVRRSYLAQEIHWGYHFVPILARASDGHVQHTADLTRFHEVVRQADMAKDLSPSEVSRIVVGRGEAQATGCNPFPQVGSNTLVISDVCTTVVEHGQTYLLFRVADTRQGQILEAHVRGYLYEWGPQVTPHKRFSTPYNVSEVALGYDTGSDRLLLRYPQVIAHTVTAESPLARWALRDSARKGRAELVIVVEGVMYATGNNIVRTAVFALPDQLKCNHCFAPMVDFDLDPAGVADWSRMHAVVPCEPDMSSSSDEHIDGARLGNGQVAG